MARVLNGSSFEFGTISGCLFFPIECSLPMPEETGISDSATREANRAVKYYLLYTKNI